MRSAKAAAVGEDEVTENRFTTLPDDVAIHILDLLSDARCLCRCSVVSKRFASLVRLVRTVSVATASWESNSTPDSDGNPQGNDQLLCLKFPVLKFLAKLKQVQSLHIDFPSCGPQLLKWGANFGTKIESITIIHPSYLFEIPESQHEDEDEDDDDDDDDSDIDDNDEYDDVVDDDDDDEYDDVDNDDDDDDGDDDDEEEEGEEEEEIDENEMLGILENEMYGAVDHWMKDFVMLCVKDVLQREEILKQVVSEHPMLQSVAITDSNKRAMKLRSSGESLVELRNSIRLERGKGLRRLNLTGCNIPVLNLPQSAIVMERVTLYMIKVFDDDGGDYDDDDYHDGDHDGEMLVAFEEEGGAFREAVVKILANHKDHIKRRFVWKKN